MESYLPLITGGGGALVVLALWVYAFFSGKVHSDREFSRLETENGSLRAALEKIQEALGLERQRADDAAQAGTVTNQLISGLVQLATEHRAMEKHEHHDAEVNADARAATGKGPLDLTGKDLGLS